jgi:hypothetical protein
MDSFRWIAVVLSIILGLGVTRLLSSVVEVFRSRNQAHLDWIPLVWAGCIFLWQIQFWWGIIELPALIGEWTIGSFLTLVSLTLLLFISAGLVLPPSKLEKNESLRESFERDGRWALVALSVYFVGALFTDWLLWNVSPVSLWGAFLIVLTLLPLLFIWSRSRRVQAAITLVYVPLSIWAALALSRASY